MRKGVLFLLAGLLAAAVLFGGCVTGAAARRCDDDRETRDSVRAAAHAVVAAYPDAGITLEEGEEGLYLRMGETRFLFGPWGRCPEALPDDPKDAPLCASLTQTYPVGEGNRQPARGFEPGRVRHEGFLKALYGASVRDVEVQLAPVDFLGQQLLFSKRHGAHAALQRVAAKLADVTQATPAARAWILPSAGTFSWRQIKNSPRLSAHSFGIAIDLNVNRGLYWLWNPSPEAVKKTRRDYPEAVVAAFESEGFIWGGKWYSFDFLHFEYRPELLHRPHPLPGTPCSPQTP